MEPGYTLHGHTRSMSSLASTIVPVPFEPREFFPPTPASMEEHTYMNDLDESRIPLPSSPAESIYSEDVSSPGTNARPVPDGAPRAIPVPEQHPSQLHIHLLTGTNDVDQNTRLYPEVDNLHSVGNPSRLGPERSISVQELIQIVRKENVELDRLKSMQERAYGLLQTCGIIRRLIPIQHRLYQLLVDCLKKDNKTAFTSLYSQFIGIQEYYYDSCIRQSAAIPVLREKPRFGTQNAGPPKSWIQRLPTSMELGILGLLQRIRTVPTFLACRIADLSSSQLSNLARPQRQSAIVASILRPTSTSNAFGLGFRQKYLPLAATESRPSRSLEHDPLHLLVHCVFDTSAGIGSPESVRQCQIWSTVCAQVIADGKPGSDEFCSTVLDSVANMYPWTLRPQLEMFLMEIIQSGVFLLEPQSSRTVDFTQPTELHNAKFAVAVAEYFDNALRSLVQLLTDGVPHGILDLVHAILAKIADSGKRIKARNFFVSRWYCGSFISEALTYPENHGILMNHHISGPVRQKILQELTIRLQRSVFDALSPWKSSAVFVQDIEASIVNLLDLFENPKLSKPIIDTFQVRDGRELPDGFLMVSQRDVLSIFEALYPEYCLPKTPGFSTEGSTTSNTSSFAGTSTLESATSRYQTGTVSSRAASTTGTSMTSETMSSDPRLTSLDHMFREDINTNGDTNLNCVTVPAEGREDEEISTKALMDGLVAMLDENTGVDILTDLSNEDFAPIYLHHSGDVLSLQLVVSEDDSIALDVHKSKAAELALATYPVSMVELETLSESLVQLFREESFPLSSEFCTCQTKFDLLRSHLRLRMNESQARYDFPSAHFWWKGHHILSRLGPDLGEALLSDITMSLETEAELCFWNSGHYEGWSSTLRYRQNDLKDTLESLNLRIKALRDKMWFLSDVRHSSTYEDALNVTRALRSMSASSEPKNAGVAAWARQRLRTSTGHETTQAQTLEALAAPKDQGGPSKLADVQVELTSRWLTRQGIENFCKGEERIHRFCLEIQKCVNRLVGESMFDSPILWSSVLYQTEKYQLGTGYGQYDKSLGQEQEFSRTLRFRNVAGPQRLNSNYPLNSSSRFPNSDITPESVSARWRASTCSSEIGGQPPGQAFHKQEYGSTIQGVISSSNPTLSDGKISIQSMSQVLSKRKDQFVGHLKEIVTSLLLSDLGLYLWNDGSETDCWITDGGLVGPNNVIFESTSTVETARHSGSTSGDLHIGATKEFEHSSTSQFPFMNTYRMLLNNLSRSADPHTKLHWLCQFFSLAVASHETANYGVQATEQFGLSRARKASFHNTRSPGICDLGVPRTRLTRLEEVLANCEERRIQSVYSRSPNHTPSELLVVGGFLTTSACMDADNSSVLKAILEDSSVRPKTLFRDLQYIAAFVPSSILDRTPAGTAFWTVAIAAMSVKSDICQSMTRRANDIVAFHYNNPHRKSGPRVDEPVRADDMSEAHNLPNDTSALQILENTTLCDAAHLYTRSALEGDPTAARELALFYLTHPELVPRVTLPFSRPAEVFKSAATGFSSYRHGKGGSMEGQQGYKGGALDPLTFAVAYHWMEFAANAGDKDARTFLHENGDLRKEW